MNLPPSLPWTVFVLGDNQPQAQRPDLQPPQTVVLVGADECKAVAEEQGMYNFEG